MKSPEPGNSPGQRDKFAQVIKMAPYPFNADPQILLAYLDSSAIWSILDSKLANAA